MAKWNLKVPAGVVPKNLPVYVALGVVSVLLFVMFLTGSGAPPDQSGPGDEEAIEAAVADVRSVVEPVLREGARLREDLARLEAQRQEEDDARRRQEAAGRDEILADARLELEGARTALLEAQRIRDAAERGGLPPGAVSGDIQAALGTVEERDLREAMRLQELERFALSLRAPAVVGDPGPAVPARHAAPPAPVITGDPLVDEQLLALLRQEAAGEAAGQVSAPPPARASAPEVVPVGAEPRAGSAGGQAVTMTEFYAAGPDIEVPESSGGGSVAVARWPAVPEGLDLVYEGRMMQAVLETALTGDFTGPARARLTLPVRTADRRRIVIPRGTVALGDAQAVENGFQTRLAVRFSRLRFPDGRSVRMGFEGLSSIGETGLTDEVNRHYRSTFGAVGAVGLLAGLSAGGGAEGYFDPARQQFSVAAIRFLDRFVNRLPEVRVRAGHPVRIYLTQDLLVPRV